ncbi:MAG: hypothetical protein RLZZ214_2089 [Verrucomicrobiota bacterium]|jgi:arylsulfatase A-like enzyme
MKHPHQTNFLVIFSALCCISPVPTRAANEAITRRPNILFIAIDDLRPEIGCYGDTAAKTPNIDRVAKAGLIFGRAYCQQAVCSPSRTSMLTGCRPDTTRVWNLSTHFRKALPDVVTLPQHFKNNGYLTRGLGKIYHSGLDDKESWSVPSTNPNAPHGAEKDDGDGRGPAFEVYEGPETDLFDGELSAMAVAALGEVANQPKPFFLAVGFIKPHLPFIAPKKYWDLYNPDTIPLAPNPFPQKDVPTFAVSGGGELHGYDGVPKERVLPDAYARKLKQGYFASTSFVDAQIGKLLDELDRLKLRENTIVVIWGDHGWKLGEHAAWAKHTNVENDTRAPLIISVPGMTNAGKTTPALVEFVDIYPSLADLAGLPKPENQEGFSFKPLFDDPSRPWKSAAFSQYPRGRRGKEIMGYTMRTDQYRFTQWVNGKDHTKVIASELFDHQADPLENTNVANIPANQEIVKKLAAQLSAGWKAALPKNSN